VSELWLTDRSNESLHCCKAFIKVFAYIYIYVYEIGCVVQDVLKRLRLIDDRVINALNTSLPTESFKEKKNSEEQCKQFCDEVCGHVVLLIFVICLACS